MTNVIGKEYKVGQIINIGYYNGFQHQTLVKGQAEIVKVFGNWIEIKIPLKYGGYKKMMGYDKELKEMENNYSK